jgi:hypothetical protein
VEETLECSLVSLAEVFLLEVIGVGRKLMLFPAVHKFIGFFRVLVGELAINKVAIRNIIIGRLVSSQLRFH